MKISKSQKFKYNTYFIAGTENIYPKVMKNNESKEEALIRIVKEFAINGLDVFQLRCKNLPDCDILKLIVKIKKAIENTNCKLCINDNAKIAYQTREIIDILHIGQNDILPQEAREIIGNKIKLGLSITDISQLENIPNCIDYLGAGPVYSTLSKKDALVPIGEIMLKSIIRKTNLPVVAIGGIQIKDIKKLFNIGVSGIAVISSLLQEKNNLNSFIKLKKQAKK